MALFGSFSNDVFFAFGLGARANKDPFTVKVAKSKDEITDLLATGFDYVCEKDGVVFFRKRK